MTQPSSSSQLPTVDQRLPALPSPPPPHHYPTQPTFFIPPRHDNNSMDMGQNEFNNFYPYTPHEVKHRKRTTAAQLSVLEGVFAAEATKPNASLRGRIATQLGMTPRAVQVWFQNRRAKAKTLTQRAKTSKAPAGSAAGGELRQQQLDDSPEVSQQSYPPQLHLDTHSTSSSSPPSTGWASSPPLLSNDSSTFLSLPQVPQHELRRGSLPNNVHNGGAYALPHLDPYARRGSVDASLHRLMHAPYAGAALVRNGNSSVRGNRFSSMAPMVAPPHRGSLTYDAPQQLTRHMSMDATALHQQHHSHHHLVNRDGYAYHAPVRPVPVPIPGPLPSQNFTFGAATSMPNVSPPSQNGESPGSEEDGRTSYNDLSRFGSLASVASSNSFYSDYSEGLQSSDSQSISGSGLFDNGGLFPAPAASSSEPNVAHRNVMQQQQQDPSDEQPSFNRSQSMPNPYGHHQSTGDAGDESTNLYYPADANGASYPTPVCDYDGSMDPGLRMPVHHESAEEMYYSPESQLRYERPSPDVGQQLFGFGNPQEQYHAVQSHLLMQHHQQGTPPEDFGEQQYGQAPAYVYDS